MTFCSFVSQGQEQGKGTVEPMHDSNFTIGQEETSSTRGGMNRHLIKLGLFAFYSIGVELNSSLPATPCKASISLPLNYIRLDLLLKEKNRNGGVAPIDLLRTMLPN